MDLHGMMDLARLGVAPLLIAMSSAVVFGQLENGDAYSRRWAWP